MAGFVDACENAGLNPGAVDADMEGHPIPSMLETDEVLAEIERISGWSYPKMPLCIMLRLEQANEQREAVVRELTAAIQEVA